jgi:hypothetical protein
MAVIHADRQTQFPLFHVMFCVPHDAKLCLPSDIMGATASGCILQQVILVAVTNVTLMWSYKATTNTCTHSCVYCDGSLIL